MGVETRTYDIPDLVLSDTFYEWFTVTNEQIIAKLNLLEVYTLGAVSISGQGTVVGDGISAGLGSGGELFIEIGSTIDKSLTINGSLTVNGSTTTINSTDFTVDDYNLILGATTESVDDENIMNYSGASAGGGIIIEGSSGDKEFLWKYTNAAWNSNQNIKLSSEKAILDGFRFATGASGGNATKGLIFGFTSGTTGGSTGSDTTIRVFNTEISAGHSADVMRITDDGYVSIANGVNKITVNQTGHGLTFGNPVYITSSGYAKAKANDLVTSEVIGIVSRIFDANRFEITTSGELVGNFSSVTETSSNLDTGAAYFLSTNTAGKISPQKTETDGYVQKPVMIGLTGDRSLILPFTGGEVDEIKAIENASFSNRIVVEQVGHGFTYGDAAYYNGSQYLRAEPLDSDPGEDSPAEVVGIVDDPAVSGNPNLFGLVMSGKFGITSGVGESLVAGQVYFLKKDTNSALERNVDRYQVGESNNAALNLEAGDVIKPCFVAINEREGIITNMLGTVLDTTEVDENLVTEVPIGTIIASSVVITDTAYLECDGSSIPAGSEYDDLRSILGSDTVPNLQGRFLIGEGTGTDDQGRDENFIIGTQGGRYRHTLSVSEMPSHNHNVSATYEYPRYPGSQGPEQNQSGGVEDRTDFNGSPRVKSASVSQTNKGGGQSHENKPPYQAVYYYIRAKGAPSIIDGTVIMGGDLAHVDLRDTAGQILVNIDPGTADNETATITDSYNLIDILPEGVNPNLVRFVTVRTSFDCDGTNATISYKYPTSEVFTSISRADDIGDHTTQTITLPVSAGQSTLEFELKYEDTVADRLTTTGDGFSVKPITASVMVDNGFTRIQKSYTSRKNLLINGNFDLWQRGVGVDSADTSTTDGLYSADRWIRKFTNISVSSGTPTIERKTFSLDQTTIPHHPKFYMEFSNPSSINLTTGGSGTNASHISMEQRIEDVRTLANKNMTVSFWAKGTSTGSCFLGFNRYFGGEASPGETLYTGIKKFSVTPNWKKYSFSVAVPTIPADAVENNDDDGYPNSYLAVAFYTALKAGSHGYNGTNDINYGGKLNIAQVQVEQGGVGTQFEIRSAGEELALAQRYYSKSLAPHLLPTASGFPDKINFNDFSVNHTANCDIVFPVEMRATPACTVHGSAGTENTIFMAQFSTTQSGQLSTGTPADIAVTSILSSHRNIHSIVVEDNGISHNNCTMQCNYTADAEL